MPRLPGASAAMVLGVLATLGLTHAGEAQSADTVRVQVAPLAPVLTTAEALAVKLDQVGFTRRRAHTGVPASQFLTRFEIEKRGVMDISQLLRRMKGRAWGCYGGLIFVDGTLLAMPIPEKEADTANYMPTTSRGKGTQMVTVAPTPKPSPLDMISLNIVDAIEVYTGPSEIPLEFKAAFRQARCVVVIWTR